MSKTAIEIVQIVASDVTIGFGLCQDDIDGDRRPIGPAPDIGADKHDMEPHYPVFLPLILRR